MLRRTLLAATATLALIGAGAGVATAAGPKVVAGPGYEPECFAPWDKKTEYFQWPAKKGPYRIALVNGYVGNTWRIQMIQTAKTYAEQPDVSEIHQGVQGHLDRDRRGGPVGCHRGLHQPGL